VDLEEEFHDEVLEYWVDGRVPHDMVEIDENNEYAKVYYGYA